MEDLRMYLINEFCLSFFIHLLFQMGSVLLFGVRTDAVGGGLEHLNLDIAVERRYVNQSND